MDRVILDAEDLEFVTKWVDENIKDMPKKPPRSLGEIKIKISGLIPNAKEGTKAINVSMTVKYKDPHIYAIKIYNYEGKRIGEFKISYEMEFDKKMEALAGLMGIDYKKVKEDLNSKYEILERNGTDKYMVQLFATIHYSVMCFFAYYKPKKIETEPAERKGRKTKEIIPERPSKKRNKDNGKEYTVVFKEYLKVVNAGKSPAKILGRKFSYAFRVRGHYRLYKNGNRVWIDEYKKGEGKSIDKTYRIEKKK